MLVISLFMSLLCSWSNLWQS